MRILLTRPLDEAQASARRLAALGHEPIIAPILEIRLLAPVWPSTRFDAVAATSRRAIDPHRPEFDQFVDLPFFGVGRRTAEAARAAGWANPSFAATSLLLAEAMLDQPAEWSWLYLAGRPRRPEIESRLALARRHLVVLETYESLPVASMPAAAAEALVHGRVDAVLHYSRASAAAFVRLAEREGLLAAAARPLHAAISAQAAEPLAGLGARLRLAAGPDEERLFAVLR